MAKSRYEYVKTFEHDPAMLPNTWLVVRIDGRGFHKFTDAHNFHKPNDVRALRLMNHAAKACMEEFQDMVLCYGESDEYSFVFKKETSLWGRRTSKITTAVVSYFTAVYVMQWAAFMKDDCGVPEPLKYPPQFDGRIVCYPALQNIRDYLSWRQADCHINNLYNTVFWTLVQEGSMNKTDAAKRLQGEGAFAKNKHEILFSEFGINYSKEDPMFRKGSIFLKKVVPKAVEASGPDAAVASCAEAGADAGQSDMAGTRPRKFTPSKKVRREVVLVHDDLIGDAFWADPDCPFPAGGTKSR